MICEHRFETQTHGLVCGPSQVASEGPVHMPLLLKRGWVTQGDLAPLPWAPHIVSYVVSIRAREGNEILWMRPFASRIEALLVYARLIGLDLDRDYTGFRLPGVWIDGELEYRFATVETFNSTPGGGTWTVPANVINTAYLVVAGGGGGGGVTGASNGGGGAGGLLTGVLVTVPGSNLTVTVGTGGATGTTRGASGNNSVFDSITALGGGGGAASSTATTGGSGGGGGNNSGVGAGAAGTVGQGNNGGTTSGGRGSGGGGASTVGGSTSTGTVAGDGGAGAASSITGSSVTYAGGGGGGKNVGDTGGAGGVGGGGNGGIGGNGSPGTANTGGGGGGSFNTNTGGAGGSGVVILSYTPVFSGMAPFIPFIP